jgi:hypothetical protein
MLRRALVIAAAAAMLLPITGSAQDSGTSLFGSLQTVFFNQKSRATYGKLQPWGGTEFREERSSFAVQQFDIFLQKSIGESFSAFVDIEYQLNYASSKHWGSLSLQEAWLNYTPMDELSLKVGLLYPAFNNLNEIKNRLALLPYIFRPGPYERLLREVFLSEDYLPEHAFIQLYGAIPHGDVFWDYAFYVGNASASYISRRGADGLPQNDLNRSFEFLTGVDPTEFNMKLFGGRLGIRAREESFKAGVSLTHDYDNLRDTTRFPPIYEGIRTPLIGDAARVRIGADCSGSIGNVRFESELIRVLYDHGPADERDIAMDQLFYYGMLGYGFTDRLFLYGSFQAGKDVFGVTSRNQTVTAGAAYQLSSDVTGKAQYIVYQNELEHGSHIDEVVIRFVFLGFSIVL